MLVFAKRNLITTFRGCYQKLALVGASYLAKGL